MTYAFPAPTRGWISNENLAAAKRGGAHRLENMFPTQTGVRVRGGSTKIATVHASNPTVSMFTYVAGGVSQLFAATATKIYDVTSVLDKNVVPVSPEVTGQTSGYYTAVQITTSGGNFLYAVNGDDEPLTYNGSAWQSMNGASTPALTGNPGGLSHVWLYKRRLWFIQGGTMSAWYLDVEAIGGALTEMPLNGVFKKGGGLLYGGTWSIDSGDGIDDKIVFATSEGEFAVYQGDDPGNATTWRIVGRYDIAKPLGKNFSMQVGGDLLLGTEDGIVPISQAVTKDPAALSLASITRAIEPDWKQEVIARRENPWEMAKWVAHNMGVVAWPVTDNAAAYCAVVNLQTGAWAKYTGWDTQCLAIHSDWLYFGTSDGKVMRAEFGGSDNGSLYESVCVCSFDHMKSFGAFKQVHMARATFLSTVTINPKVSVSVNYTVRLPSAPSAVSDAGLSNEWDSGLWDTAVWDGSGSGARTARMKWVSIGRSGSVIAPQVQITFGGENQPDAELMSIDMIYEHGEIVV